MANIVPWNHVPKKNNIDYSECICEPDLVLSMREIIDKYLQTGQVPAGIASNGYYSDVDYDDAHETDYDDNLDVLCEAKHIQYAAEEARRQTGRVKSSDETTKESKNEDEPKQSDAEASDKSQD